MQFQFTQPKRAATGSSRPLLIMITRFNSRSPSGLRRLAVLAFSFVVVFQFTQPKRAATEYEFSLYPKYYVSIHAAQAGCDAHQQATRARRAVSIHAAQAGCDILTPNNYATTWGFNSRSPSGLRQAHAEIARANRSFNSRSPSGLRLDVVT